MPLVVSEYPVINIRVNIIVPRNSKVVLTCARVAQLRYVILYY